MKNIIFIAFLAIGGMGKPFGSINEDALEADLEAQFKASQVSHNHLNKLRICICVNFLSFRNNLRDERSGIMTETEMASSQRAT